MYRIQNRKKNCHLAQLRNAVINFSSPKIIKRILATGIDVNHKFLRTTSDDDSSQSGFSTALHLAADKRSVTNFKTLLDHGADATIKDSDGLTALHRGISLNNNVDESYENPFVTFALSAQVASNNPANPRDDRGFTHFHAACLTNHVKAVEFLLSNGASVDHAMNRDSPLFPGYTPLHFAARFASLETAKLLIEKGANAKLTDARGMTPLHVLIERKVAMLELVYVKEALEDESVQTVLNNINDNEEILMLLLDSMDDRPDDIGMTKHQAICTLQKSSVAVSLLEGVSPDVRARVKLDSPIWAGYTMLHFAAHCNFNMLRLLVEKGADIRAKDANGVTPFDIFVERCSMRDLHVVVSTISLWSDVSFSDGKTKLLDCILAMESLDQFKTFVKDCVDDVNICLPTDSALWPGSTLLHLSVIFAERFASVDPNRKLPSQSTNRVSFHIVKACRDLGVSIYARDVHGRTPLHLAFRLSRLGDESRVVDMLLRSHHSCSNPVDDENLSLLHIACATRNTSMIEEWLRDSAMDVSAVYEGGLTLHNVQPGWTPLHVAVSSNANSSLAKMLLWHGADPYRVDRNNLTPIHHLLLAANSGRDPNKSSKLLLSLTDLRESDVAAAAFTHLHVASYFNHVQAVERLLDRGVDIDAVASLPLFENCTPLHFAMMNESVAVVDVLVRRSANVLARGPNGSTPLSEVLTSNKHRRSLNTFVHEMRRNHSLKRHVKWKFGLTMLHVVCHAGHVNSVEYLLRKGAYVNAKMRYDSPFWPGWSPLHVLVAAAIETGYRKERFETILEMLLRHGARVTVTNADGDTPLHLMLKKHPCDATYSIMTFLLSSQRDFSVNPVNKDGATHFHAACLANNVEAVKKFLAHAAVDVNRPIGYFAEHYAGSTSLHLAFNFDSKRYFGYEAHMRVVALLLQECKADLQAGDDYAYTPVHVAADSDPSCLVFLDMLLENGADMNSQTIDGKTAFEIRLRSKDISVEEIEFFSRWKYRINDCNPITDIGYLSIILNEKNVKLRTDIIKALTKAPNIVVPDEMGRTPIHNIVATNNVEISEHDYVELVDKLAKLGCDVNEKDETGMTALHLALLFRNEVAATALLICGVDINIVDSRGKTAFMHALHPCTHCRTPCNTTHDSLLEVLVEHVHKLKLAGLYVSERNERIKALALLENRWIRDLDLPAKLTFTDEKGKETDAMVIGPRGWTLRDFLKEYGAVNDYRTLTQGERRAIDQFFETVDYRSFPELKYMLKVQYRHAVARGALFGPAMDSIKHLFGLPDLCAKEIVWYLRNPDLKNLIFAADRDD